MEVDQIQFLAELFHSFVLLIENILVNSHEISQDFKRFKKIEASDSLIANHMR